MNMIVCSVFDMAAGVYSRPFFTASIGLAVRGFTDEVNRVAPDNPLASHPGDFALYHLGSFDDNDGSFSMHVKPVRLAQAADVKV